MPVCLMRGRECPSNGIHRQAVLNVSVFGHVERVVVVDEIAPVYMLESHEGGSGKKKTDKQDLSVS
jgi:hypothetical protein